MVPNARRELLRFLRTVGQSDKPSPRDSWSENFIQLGSMQPDEPWYPEDESDVTWIQEAFSIIDSACAEWDDFMLRALMNRWLAEVRSASAALSAWAALAIYGFDHHPCLDPQARDLIIDKLRGIADRGRQAWAQEQGLADLLAEIFNDGEQ